MRIGYRYQLCCLLSVLFAGLKLSATDSIPFPVLRFVNEWRSVLNQEDFKGDSISHFFAERVSWYNKNYSNDSVCATIKEDALLESCIFAGEPTILPIGKKDVDTWQVFFRECNGVISAEKSHYLLIVSHGENDFHIIAQSSLADDAWMRRKNQIAKSKIQLNNKRYYILEQHPRALIEDSCTILFLTDTLLFYEPKWMPVCNGLDQIGYSAIGRIFVAVYDLKDSSLQQIQEITKELTEPTYQDAELILGGFPCLVNTSSYYPAQPAYITDWGTPYLIATEWTPDFNRYSIPTLYMYGDRCLEPKTTITISKRGRHKITVEKIPPPKPPKRFVPH